MYLKIYLQRFMKHSSASVIVKMTKPQNNVNVSTLTQSITTRIVYLFSRPLRAAWYQEMAIRYGLCQQPSRPFCMEKL